MMKTKLLAFAVAALCTFSAQAQKKHLPEQKLTAFQRAEIDFKSRFKMLPLQKPGGLSKTNGSGQIVKATNFRWESNAQQWSTDTFQVQYAKWHNDGSPEEVIAEIRQGNSRYRMVYTDFTAVEDYYFLDYLKGFVPKTTLSQEFVGGQWQDTEKYIYTLDDENRISKIDYYYWNIDAWLPSQRYDYHYDSHGNYSGSTQKVYEETEWNLIYGEKYNFVYDGEKITEVITEEFTPDHDDWQQLEKQVYTYQNNKIATAVSYEFDGNQWLKYDSIANINWKNFVNGLPQHAYYYPFTIGGSSYYSYDSYFFNEDDQVWEKDLQVTQTFTNNLLTENYMKMWNEDSAAYVNFRRRITDYYADENLKEFKIYNWFMTEQNSFWSLSHGTRSNISYNNDDLMESRIDQMYRTGTQSWENNMKYIYEYDMTTSVAPVASQNFSMFPNPATDRLNITLKDVSTADVRITSITGQVIKTERHNSTATFSVDVASLPKGIYFIDVMQNNQKSTQRFIKQ